MPSKPIGAILQVDDHKMVLRALKASAAEPQALHAKM